MRLRADWLGGRDESGEQKATDEIDTLSGI